MKVHDAAKRISQAMVPNPIQLFSDRAHDYRRYRPGYPPAAIDAILEGYDDLSQLRAADVGSGTGISSRALAARGVQVIAVEPNAEMRDCAQLHPNVEWIEGTAESTGLSSNSVDIVLCANAFHWFEQEKALVEFARILKPNGRLALMWNSRDRNDAFTSAYIDAIQAVDGESAAETRAFDPAVVSRRGLFEIIRHVQHPNVQRLDLDGLLGRAQSASGTPKHGTAGRMLAQCLTKLHKKFAKNGVVTMVYNTQVYLAHRLSLADFSKSNKGER